MASTGASRWTALGAVVLAVLAVGLDLTVLSVALPTLAGALKASESDLQWFSSGYALVLAAGMLPAGLLGDRYGRKKIMLVSLLLFALGSLACAYSRSPGEFVASRVLLGVAGAGIIVMAVSALTVLFTEEERPRAVGIWAAANMLAFPIGPILGGWLLSHYWWGWVFLLNVPIAIVGFAAVAVLVPESRAQVRPGIDRTGIVASSGGLVGVTYGLIEAGQHGWGSAQALIPLVLGLLVITAFFFWERALERRPKGQPVLELGLFGSRAFTWGVVLFAILTATVVGLLFVMPQYFQEVVGVNAEGAGIRLLPVVGGLLVGVLPAQRLARRLGAKATIAAGFTLLGAGIALGSMSAATSGELFIASWMALGGAGFGLTMTTAASAALAELSEEKAGVGSGVLQALKNVGAPLGTAVLGSVLSSAYVSRLPRVGIPGTAARSMREGVFGGVLVAHALHSTSLLLSVRDAFVHGMDLALLVSVGFAAAGIVATLLFMPGRTFSQRAHDRGKSATGDSDEMAPVVEAADAHRQQPQPAGRHLAGREVRRERVGN